MNKSEMGARLRDRGGWLPGKRIKMDFGDAGILLMDGIAGTVSEEDGPADTVIAISWGDLQALERRELDPVSAMMQGRLRIEGDMGNAMKLQSVIAKLRD